MKWEQFAAKQPVLSTNLKYGAGLGIILLLLALIENLAGNSIGIISTGLLWINVALVALCYLRTSYLAARQTDRMSSGTIAGLVTGITAYLINLLGHLLVLPIYSVIAHTQQTTHLSIAAQLSAAALTLFSWLIIYGFLGGVVLGFIGGNIGIHHYPAARQEQPKQQKQQAVTSTTPSSKQQAENG
jgi:hypothetical protein